MLCSVSLLAVDNGSGFCSEIQISQTLDNLVQQGDAAAVTQQLLPVCLCSIQAADSSVEWFRKMCFYPAPAYFSLLWQDMWETYSKYMLLKPQSSELQNGFCPNGNKQIRLLFMI